MSEDNSKNALSGIRQVFIGVLLTAFVGWIAWVSSYNPRITALETESRINKEKTTNDKQDGKIEVLDGKIDSEVEKLEKSHRKLEDKVDTEMEEMDERLDELEK